MKPHTLVTLHGFLGNQTALTKVTHALRTEFASIVHCTLPGHDGQRFERDWRWDDALTEIAGSLKIHTSIVLFGYSMGARLALGLLLEKRLPVHCAVLVGAHPGISSPREREERTQWESMMAAKVLSEGVAKFAEHWEAMPLWETQRALSSDVRAEIALRRRGHVPEGIAWAMRALGTGSMPNYQEKISALSTPMLWLAGEKDLKFRALALQATALNTHCVMQTVDGAGHDCTVEAPLLVAQHMDRWLKAQS